MLGNKVNKLPVLHTCFLKKSSSSEFISSLNIHFQPRQSRLFSKDIISGLAFLVSAYSYSQSFSLKGWKPYSQSWSNPLWNMCPQTKQLYLPYQCVPWDRHQLRWISENVLQRGWQIKSPWLGVCEEQPKNTIKSLRVTQAYSMENSSSHNY